MRQTSRMLQLLSWLLLVSVIESWPAANTCRLCSCGVRFRERLVRFANCSSRDLTAIPDDLPFGLDELDLSSNNIPAMDLSKLNQFDYLKNLSIAYNNITIVPKLIFSNASRMQEIDLTGNLLEVLDEDTFKDLPYLRVIKGLEVKKAVWNSFEGLVALQELHLTLHHQEIPENLFNGLNLNSLRLNLFSVDYLPLKLFRFGSKTLAVLEIDGPELNNFHEDTFYGLSVLRTIIIHAPKVHTLPTYIFHKEHGNNSMPINLVKIVVNDVKSLPRHIFRHQQSLETIELHGVEDLPSGLFDEAKTLDHLDLSYCDVYSVSPNWFASLSSLKTLNLSHTPLMTIDAETFTGLNSLTVLDISNSNINTIDPSAFRHFRFTLVDLRINGNRLSTLKNGLFKDLRSLEKLDLSSNKLALSRTDAHIFWDLKKLIYLHLQDNELLYLPSSVFYSQTDLQNLDLAHNKISELPKELLSQTISLRFLDLSGNHLGKLPDGFLSRVLFLEELKLMDNPLNCDCDIMLLKESKAELRMLGNCSWPPRLAGVLLSNLETDEQCFMSTSSSLEISSSGFLMSSLMSHPSTASEKTAYPTMTIEKTSRPIMTTKMISSVVTTTPALYIATSTEPGIIKTKFVDGTSHYILPTSVHDFHSTFLSDEVQNTGPELKAETEWNSNSYGLSPSYTALAIICAVFIVGAIIIGALYVRRRLRSRDYEVTSANGTSGTAARASETPEDKPDMTSGVEFSNITNEETATK